EVIHQEDLAVIDCLLPGQIRKLGQTRYISARRAIKTTGHDCEIRGGEYVAYDRADYQSALAVWLPLASAGDAKAQNYVGEIYEKGLGIDTDYQQAAYWYNKAAEQSYARAQINLGLLNEKGLGVERNLPKALEYYRLASGVSDDAVLLSTEAKKALEEEKRALEGALAASIEQAQDLGSELRRLEAKEQQRVAHAEADQHVNALRALYDRSVAERSRLQGQLDSMSLAYRKFTQNELLTPASFDLGAERVAKDINFGRYYALIIGNQEYQFLDDLSSPLQDAERLQSVLEDRYGFTTQLISNGSEKDVLMAINRLFNELTERDNLLIFYAGHGELSTAGLSRKERGYWLPVDAQANNISHWINNAVISDHLDRLKARSVLVISDSCFAGYLGEDKSPYLFGLSDANLSRSTIEAGLDRRSRIVISSGGERPVLDGNGSNHSVFAGALIDALEANDKPLRDSQLFSLLSVNVAKRADALAMRQKPEMKPVREAGHEGGSFYFVPSEK
ncbi:MAG TPA: caspase family protein, partial [Marinagarivorans sp.]